MIEFLHTFNGFLTLWVVCPGIILVGLYLTWRLRGLQVTKLKLSARHLFKKDEGGEGEISHFQAVASVLAANFGTGNISGMAVALAMGGPGALLWMWVMAFFGAIIQFANSFLGVKYRKKAADGSHYGGPMYYLAEGLKSKTLAIAFSLLVIVAAATCGVFVQTNSIALPLQTFGIAPWLTGLALALSVGVVIIGGAQRVAHVSAAVVPTMGILYLGAAFIVIGAHFRELGPALALFAKAAFSTSSLVGGVAGYGVTKALTVGFDRGIFATDAGTGTAPMLQSGARSKSPVIDGLVTLVAPFLVMIVCTVTALTLIVTGAWQGGAESTQAVIHAFNGVLGAKAGTFIVFTALALFGYTTILGWAACMERAVVFLIGPRFIRIFQLLYLIIIPLGAGLQVGVVWMLADLSLTSMLLINLIGVAGLSREVIADTKQFFYTPAKGVADAVDVSSPQN